MKGFPAWPAMISKPEEWGLSSVKKKLLVYFYGTKQIAFCNYADLEAFTEEKKKSLLVKRQGKGADFVRAVDEIIDIYESLKKENHNELNLAEHAVRPDDGNQGHNNNFNTEGPEKSSILANNKKSASLSVSAGNHDVVSSDKPNMTITENELCIVNSAPDEPVEKLSILDELRATPLSTSSFSRKKRQRDLQPQNCYTRTRFPSSRRSRSSLSVEPKKIQDSGMPLNDSSLVSGDLSADVVQEESAQNKSIGDDETSSDVPAAIPDAVGLPSYGGQTCDQPETPGINNSVNNLNFSSKLESSCNSEVSQTGCLEKEVKLNGRPDLPMNTVIFKRKRKPNRKRANCSTEYAGINKEADLQVESSGNLMESPNSRNEVNKSDGDEHLPLVKRARVRMGRPLLDDTLVHEHDAADNKKSEMATFGDQSDKHDASTTSGNSCSADGMRSGVRNYLNTSPTADTSVPPGEGPTVWKNKDYQPKILMLDVEAALPPSKRLHRALEAMSANAAETINHLPEATGTKELIPNGCSSPLTSSLANNSADAILQSPRKSQGAQSLDNLTGKKGTSELIVLDRDVPTLVCSDVKIDDLPNALHDKVCEEILDSKRNDCSIVSNGVDDDAKASCSIKFNEASLDSAYSESVPDQLSSSLEKVNENEIIRPKGCPTSHMDKRGDRSAEPVNQKKVSVSDANGVCGSIPHDETVLAESTINVGDTASTSSLATKSSSIQSDADTRTFEMHTFSVLVSKEVTHKINLKDKSISPDSMPMKELIAAAQARRLLSRSNSFVDNFVDSKFIPETLLNPPAVLKEGSTAQPSPSNCLTRSASTTDRVHTLQNCGRTPFDGLQQKGLNKLTGHDEANTARKAFEAFLCTLTRTKESIGRATRLAMECAKYGIAGEAVDIILEHLEKESNLYKRVDLFFLVDSITQCSRNQKGGAGDVYPSLIQAVLPRLICAAAPPGNSAWENRRQCLKVLKLWLERKTLPEYIIRHHIRELDTLNEASFGSSSSRRPSRTERAINDPLRENEGMLVDEYGSNTSFHLPNLLCTKVLEDEDGSSSEERSFEAVTPEQEAQATEEKETTHMPAEKHRHVLEDVDGELEMEDVAPPSELEVSSACQPAGTDTICTQSDQHLTDSAPPLPDDRPPSPPPLPSSPPPMPPPPPATDIPQAPQLRSDSHIPADPPEPHPHRVTYNAQSQPPHSIADHPGNMNPCVTSSQPVQFYHAGYGGHPNQMLPPAAPLSTPGSHGNFSASAALHPGNNYQQLPSASLPNKPYHLQPPPPTVSNQFSYIQSEPQQRPQPWGNCSSFPERYQYNVHDRENHYGDRGSQYGDRGNHFGDGGIRGPMHHEVVERGRFTPPFQPAHSVPDKIEASPAPLHYGRPSDSSPMPCPGWSIPPRISSYHLSASRPPMEAPVSRVSGAPGYWRPR